FTSDERNKAMQKAMKLDERTAGGYIENLEEELRRREAADGSRHEAKEARLASPTTEAAPAPTNSDGHRTEAGPASDEWEDPDWDDGAPFSDGVEEDDLPR